MFTIKYDISKINVVIESDVDNCLSFFMPFCLLRYNADCSFKFFRWMCFAESACFANNI